MFKHTNKFKDLIKHIYVGFYCTHFFPFKLVYFFYKLFNSISKLETAANLTVCNTTRQFYQFNIISSVG